MTRSGYSRPIVRDILLVSLACLVAIPLYGRIEPDSARFAKWDLHLYRRMADAAPGLALDVRPPFVYRILGPYVSGILPMERDSAFLLVTLSAALLVPLMLYLLLCRAGVRSRNAALAAVLLVFNKWLFGFAVWDYFQTGDLLSLLSIMLLLWAAYTSRWPAFGLILALGVLTRETVILAPLVVLVYLLESGRWQTERRAFLISLVPATLIVLTLVLAANAHGASPLYYAGAAWTYWHSVLDPQAWVRLLVSAFAPVSLLPLLRPGRTWEILNKSRHLLLLYALAVGLVAFVGMQRWKWGIVPVVLGAGAVGLLYRVILGGPQP
ncbi:MAG: hypothetical protein FJX73_04595 [Armatimonadetes bacterium]|nr:hypothetical protein [Armatimonadota bacterium]